MGINPLKIMQLKDAWMQFNRRHPKLAPFFRAIQAKALKEGTVIEMKVTTPEGKSLVASIRLTEADMELFRQATSFSLFFINKSRFLYFCYALFTFCIF